MVTYCPSTLPSPTHKNKAFITRWKRVKQSKEVEFCGRIHSDICNVWQNLPTSVRMQIKFTKARWSFYLMNKDADSKNFSKFLEAWLFVNRVKPNPTILLAHNATLTEGALARHNLTRVKLKTFAFSSGSQSIYRQRRVWTRPQTSPFNHGEEH